MKRASILLFCQWNFTIFGEFDKRILVPHEILHSIITWFYSNFLDIDPKHGLLD